MCNCSASYSFKTCAKAFLLAHIFVKSMCVHIIFAGRDPVLFCDGCYAVVSELQQEMVASKVTWIFVIIILPKMAHFDKAVTLTGSLVPTKVSTESNSHNSRNSIQHVVNRTIHDHLRNCSLLQNRKDSKGSGAKWLNTMDLSFPKVQGLILSPGKKWFNNDLHSRERN